MPPRTGGKFVLTKRTAILVGFNNRSTSGAFTGPKRTCRIDFHEENGALDNENGALDNENGALDNENGALDNENEAIDKKLPKPKD